VRKPRGGKSVPPLPGPGVSLPPQDAGEPVYHTPFAPAKSVVRLKPADQAVLVDAGDPLTPEQAEARRAGLGLPDPRRPLVPASEEVAELPRAAREAFSARCAARVARLRAGAATPEAAAALILAAATVSTPVRRLLLCLRRDFDRLARLAKRDGWTDDTPVPPDVFGPMWPGDLTPEWAKEPSSGPPAE
jgi:hypothetical protein